MSRRFATPGIWFAAAALIYGYGCGGGEATGPDPNPASPVQTALSQIDAREAEHHSFAAHAIDARAIREEAAGYACDMGPLMDRMLDECRANPDVEMGPHHDMRAIRHLADSMLDMIERHRIRMSSLPTIEEMREECEEHHDSMAEMMHQMDDELPGGGMMGGGMMGGGMMGGRR